MCPKCKKMIDDVIAQEPRLSYYRYYPCFPRKDGDKRQYESGSIELDCEFLDEEPNGGPNHFACSKCGGILFYDENEVLAWFEKESRCDERL